MAEPRNLALRPWLIILPSSVGRTQNDSHGKSVELFVWSPLIDGPLPRLSSDLFLIAIDRFYLAAFQMRLRCFQADEPSGRLIATVLPDFFGFVWRR
jgi:hypothetical protein